MIVFLRLIGLFHFFTFFGQDISLAVTPFYPEKGVTLLDIIFWTNLTPFCVLAFLWFCSIVSAYVMLGTEAC